MATKRLSPAAIVALKDALCSIYWYKADLRSFLSSTLTNKTMIAALNWDNYKRQIVTDLVDALIANQDKYLGDLTRLCNEVTSINNFSHLAQLNGGDEKAQRAKDAVEQLRQLVELHEDKKKEDDGLERRRKQREEKLRSNSAVKEKLAELNRRFLAIASDRSPQARGFDLERLMYDIFKLFDLDQKASFKNNGEQIDGAFSLEGTDYLFEAKWQNKPVGVQDLDAFAAKVKRKLDNSLGVFLSMNSFSPDGVAAHSASRPSLVLMDGADLMAILEERIDFDTLLVRKKRHAAQTWNIYLKVHEIHAK